MGVGAGVEAYGGAFTTRVVVPLDAVKSAEPEYIPTTESVPWGAVELAQEPDPSTSALVVQSVVAPIANVTVPVGATLAEDTEAE